MQLSPLKKIVVVSGVGLLAWMVLSKSGTSASGASIPSTGRLNAEAFSHLDGMSDPDRVQVARWLADEASRQGFTRAEVAALLSMAHQESRFDPGAVSSAGLPDDAGGRSWGVLQFIKTTLTRLHFTKEDVTPRSTADIERAVRQSVRVAKVFLTWPRWQSWVKAMGEPHFLAAVRARSSDPYEVACDIFAGWPSGTNQNCDNATEKVRQKIANRMAVFPPFLEAVS